MPKKLLAEDFILKENSEFQPTFAATAQKHM